MKAVIMAGGEGVRLRPFTYMVPKPLLPIGGITILEYAIRNLEQCGYSEIFVSMNYQSNQFRNLFKSKNKFSVQIHLIEEEFKMGTAGSLLFMKKFFREPFCVINGDLIANVKLDEMTRLHLQSNAEVTIGIKRYTIQIPYGVIEQDKNGKFVKMTEKPSPVYYINSGIYILSPSVFTNINPNQYLDMPTLIQHVQKRDGLISLFDVGEKWLDIGHVSDYERALDLIGKWKE